ncbi:Hypothetical predicted protein [Scomber scombrus]|uniref:Uncharacterized protein n=1 Tax=Scomber scombrus TaxID=13677 RepID=A0AAV1MSZ2_SCOSC
MDAAKRITPSGVLTHPFIVGGHHNSGNEASQAQSMIEPTEKTSANKSRTSGGAGSISTPQSPSPVMSQSDSDSDESYTRLLANVNKIQRLEEWACPGVSDLKDNGTTRINTLPYSISCNPTSGNDQGSSCNTRKTEWSWKVRRVIPDDTMTTK